MARNAAALRLSAWIGKLGRGSAVLRFDGQRLVFHLEAGTITSVEGDDGEILAGAFGLPPQGDWFAEARAAVAQGLVTPDEAAAVLKRALTSQLKRFFLASEATLEVFPGQPRPGAGFLISYPHVIYELVLKEGGELLVPVFLPDPSAVLRRLPGFSRWVGELQLPDEALAILAKVNDSRSAEAIAEPSPHGKDMVFRFLAATVGAGLVEVELQSLEEPAPDTEPPVTETQRRRRRWWWVVPVLAASVAAVLLLSRPLSKPASERSQGPWSIAVGGACQPAELEQLYRLRDRDRERLRVVPFGASDPPCYRLVWGFFATREEAEAAVGAVPESLVQRGFQPHAVSVSDNSR